MAGNVKEWCWNETNHGRFILGGGWNESQDTFDTHDARDPIRAGSRIRLPACEVHKAALARGDGAGSHRGDRPGSPRSTPVSEEVFEVYRSQHAYNRGSLNAVVEGGEETEIWRKETVVLDAAYGGERFRVHLFLPKTERRRIRPSSSSRPETHFECDRARIFSLAWGDVIIRSGRAFVFPVYKGTFERSSYAERGSQTQRELAIAVSRDPRPGHRLPGDPGDVDGHRLAFYGVSAGAEAGVLLTTLEPRLKASVLQGVGVESGRSRRSIRSTTRLASGCRH